MTPFPYLLETTIAHIERERMADAARYRLLREARRSPSENEPDRPATRSFWDGRAIAARIRGWMRPIDGGGKRRVTATDSGLTA